MLLQVAEGMWDTPESAKAVLTSLANHREDLEGMQLPDGSNAADTLQRGLDDAQGGTAATPAAVAVLEHLLYHQDQVCKVCYSSAWSEPFSRGVSGGKQDLPRGVGALQLELCCSSGHKLSCWGLSACEHPFFPRPGLSGPHMH